MEMLSRVYFPHSLGLMYTAVTQYLGFLKGGSSTDPLSLLRGAGVDMTTPEPIERSLEVFSERTDRLEALLT